MLIRSFVRHEMIRFDSFVATARIVTNAGCRASRLQAPVHQKISTAGYSRRSCHSRRFVSCYRSWEVSDHLCSRWRYTNQRVHVRSFAWTVPIFLSNFVTWLHDPQIFQSSNITLLAYIFSIDYISLLDGRMSPSLFPSRHVSVK